MSNGHYPSLHWFHCASVVVHWLHSFFINITCQCRSPPQDWRQSTERGLSVFTSDKLCLAKDRLICILNLSSFLSTLCLLYSSNVWVLTSILKKTNSLPKGLWGLRLCSCSAKYSQRTVLSLIMFFSHSTQFRHGKKQAKKLPRVHY